MSNHVHFVCAKCWKLAKADPYGTEGRKTYQACCYCGVEGWCRMGVSRTVAACEADRNWQRMPLVGKGAL